MAAHRRLLVAALTCLLVGACSNAGPGRYASQVESLRTYAEGLDAPPDATIEITDVETQCRGSDVNPFVGTEVTAEDRATESDPATWVEFLRTELEGDGWQKRGGVNGEYRMWRRSSAGHDEHLRLYANDDRSGFVTLSFSPTDGSPCS